jgi:hypothetical protein
MSARQKFRKAGPGRQLFHFFLYPPCLIRIGRPSGEGRAVFVKTTNGKGSSMKNTKNTLGRIIAGLALIGITHTVAMAQITNITERIKTVIGTDGGSGCPGGMYGFVRMTNSVGSIWLTPPAGTTLGVLSDISGYPPPYSSRAVVEQRSNGVSWCDTNSVTFPATNSTSYMLVIVVKTTPPPTNVIVQLQWY